MNLHQLIEEARILGWHKTQKEAVMAALTEYIQRRKQISIIELFGTIDYAPAYDYKAVRRRKRVSTGEHSAETLLQRAAGHEKTSPALCH